MSNELKHKLNSPGDCLSEKTMLDYIDQKLSPRERHLVEKHMLDCELCSDAMEGLELVKDRKKIMTIRNAVESRLTGERETTVVPFRFRTVLSIAAAIALLVVGVFFFNKTSESLKDSGIAELTNTESAPPPPPPPADSTGGAIPAEETEKAEKKKEGLLETPAPVTTDEEVAVLNKVTSEYYKEATGDEVNRKASGESPGNGDSQPDQTIAGTVDNRWANKPVPETVVNEPGLVNTAKQDKTAENSRDKFVNQKNEEQKNTQGPYTYNTTISTKQPDAAAAKDNSNSAAGNTGELANDKDLEKSVVYREEAKKGKDKSKSPQKSRADEKEQVVATGGTFSTATPSATTTAQSNTQQEISLDDVSEDLKIATDSVSVPAFETIYVNPQFDPVYPGGKSAMEQFVSDNIALPARNSDGVKMLNITIELTVMPNGKAINGKLTRPINPLLNKQVAELVTKMPLWKPGKQDGKAVYTKMIIPMTIKAK